MRRAVGDPAMFLARKLDPATDITPVNYLDTVVNPDSAV